MYDIKELYQLNIELEGILRVLEQRDSVEARILLAQKFNVYSQAMQQLLDSGNEAPVETVSSTPKQVVIREEPKPVTTVAEAAAATDSRAIKLDEMLSARQSADLSKAFTLNDKYRFRRELFGGSDSDFSHTIDLIVSMNSYEEARDYLLRDLCWDSQNEAVEDFLTIIKRHFQA